MVPKYKLTASSCLWDTQVCATCRMGKWAVGLLLLVALVQVQEVLCRSAGQAAALAPNVETLEERALPGFEGALTGLFSQVT